MQYHPSIQDCHDNAGVERGVIVKGHARVHMRGVIEAIIADLLVFDRERDDLAVDREVEQCLEYLLGYLKGVACSHPAGPDAQPSEPGRFSTFPRI
jgi:hypothetical protein